MLTRRPIEAWHLPDSLDNLGSDLLVFIHGFDNTFSDAISRAAFNREWLAASGLPGTNTTVVAFSWPSSGRVVGLRSSSLWSRGLPTPRLSTASVGRYSPNTE